MRTAQREFRRSALAAVAGAAVVCAAGLASNAHAQIPANILHTPHNLSVTGTGTYRALTETRICIFCHTPHNATPLSPLWNKALEPQVYAVYTSPSPGADPMPQPSGPTKLCLSCHDGTIALGDVVNPAGGITMNGSDMFPSDSLSNFGLDLSSHHPVSFSYQDALPNPELVSAPPADLVFGNSDEVHCTTCHDPHDDTNGKFLSKDNRYSALCISCHEIPGWVGSAHATSTASVSGILPRSPKTWPTYTQLNEWGCEVCHTPHFAPTAGYLLNFTDLPPEPFSCISAGCHSADPAPAHATTGAAPGAAARTTLVGGGKDIAGQTRKRSAHRELPGLMALRTNGAAKRNVLSGVTCVDCHNPHITQQTEAEPPYASGALQGVDGVDRNGMQTTSVRYQYEVCFKCHADDSADFDFVPRVMRDINKRRAFDPGNPSYHPVIAMGKNMNIPSIPSDLAPDMSPSSLMYCTTCHADDEGGSDGPHGSSFAPILKERYETADYTSESFDNYALCYRCHDRSNILSNSSFRTKTARTTPSGGGHSGHLSAGTPCSACHDPHGISDWGMQQAGAAGPGGTGNLAGFQEQPALGGFGDQAGLAEFNGQATAGPFEQTNSAGTGSHTHLVNFDTSIVSPKPGTQYPVFTDTGTFSGSCNLVCHGVTHDNASYP